MADAILVLNNHPENVKLEHVLLSLSDKHRLVFIARHNLRQSAWKQASM